MSARNPAPKRALSALAALAALTGGCELPLGGDTSQDNAADAGEAFLDKATPGAVLLDAVDSWVDSGNRSRNHGSDRTLELDGAPSTKHVLIKPANLGSIARGAQVESARLVLEITDRGNRVSVRELNGSWSESGVTYANAPGRGSEFARFDGAIGTVRVDVTQLMQSWVNGEPMNGLSLYPTADNGVDFASSEASDANSRPFFEVVLSEPDAGGNLALGKPTSQSSIDYRGASSRAVDGDTNGRWSAGSVTHTRREAGAWWRVELGGAHRVDGVTLWNRTDCCTDRLSNFHVDYLDEAGNVIASEQHPGRAATQTDIGLSARGVHAVRVQLNGTNPLSLAEVEVWGEPDSEGDALCVSANERNTARLSCPAGETITRVDFASYGLPQGSCDTELQLGSCHSTRSQAEVSAACVGAQSCEVSASNGVFGDPCPGRGKRLSVVYTCGGGGNGGGGGGGPEDNCPQDPDKLEPGLCGCGTPDSDRDGDGTPDCNDGCSDDANKTSAGACGCGVADTDSDGDGAADCQDQCPADADKLEPGECGCGTPEGSCTETCSSTMAPRESLEAGEVACSDNGTYRFGLDQSGDVVLWKGSEVRWRAGASDADVLSMQSDGNLVAYTDAGDSRWSSRTHRNNGADLKVHDNGNVEVRLGGNTLWETGTGEDSGGGDNGGGDDDGGGSGDGEISHVGTTEVYDSNGQDLRINRPSGSRAGDLLVLILHRTDDVLPLNVDGWTRAASCYKRDNSYDCSTAADCTNWYDSDFCERFGDYGRGGLDLAQSIHFRTVGSQEPSSYRFDLNRDSSGHPGWAILTALRGADNDDPLRDWSNTGCDKSADSLFPSVYGEPGDMVLLSQSFDDAIAQSKFGPPPGTASLGYVSRSDEAGFLFGGVVTRSGQTGALKTSGDGGPSCKDALVSITIRAR